MMWLATIRPGMTQAVVTEVIGEEIVFTAAGFAQRRPRRAFARRTRDGGATALSQTPQGAVASAKCVLTQSDLERELLGKRDRA